MKTIIGRILGRPPDQPGKIVVMDVDTNDVYTFDRMIDRRMIEPIEDGRSGYGGLLYEFEIEDG